VPEGASTLGFAPNHGCKTIYRNIYIVLVTAISSCFISVYGRRNQWGGRVGLQQMICLQC